MHSTVHCCDLAMPPQDGQNVAEYVPLWMTAGTLKDVAGVCLMAALAERRADALALFASN